MYKRKKLLLCFVILFLMLVPTFHLTAGDEDKPKDVSLNPPLETSVGNPDKPSAALVHEKKPVKNVKRAFWEAIGHFAYATSSYWIRQDVMKEDWEYHFTWEDQKKRIFLLDGFRMDSNSYAFNWTHSLAGGIYYNYARTNRFNKSGSLLYTIACSFLWESLVEFREVISINDMIATPLGGIGFGEATFQLGRLFRSQRPTFFNKIARLASNPIMSINEWLDRKKYKNQFAFQKGQFWNDCRLVAGPRFDTISGQSTHNFMQLGLETQVFNLPDYGEQGSSSLYLKDTLYSEYNMSITFSDKGMHQFDFFAKPVLFGYFSQKIQGSSASHDRRGYSLFIGAACGFDVMSLEPKSELPANSTVPDKEDKHCIINLLGPAFDLSIYRDKLKIRFSADAYPDFALIHSHVYKKYAQLHEVGTTKSTLWEHGYYYALGLTLSSQLQIEYANLELKGAVKFHYYDSIEGMDRFQSDITPGSDFDLKDQRITYRFSLGYHIPKTPLRLTAGLEKIDRWGKLEDFAQSSSEKRSFMQIQYLF
ncbi:MAG TPA: DUF3943 domain-containing protein [Candidatus Deferrimicrobium sp.]|nr:DUF3943 domain-containing protein [Candidatus Deferrimicrobium sp.]